MIEVIKSPTPVTEKTQWTVFLAGPMNGAPSWQAQAPKLVLLPNLIGSVILTRAVVVDVFPAVSLLMEVLVW